MVFESMIFSETQDLYNVHTCTCVYFNNIFVKHLRLLCLTSDYCVKSLSYLGFSRLVNIATKIFYCKIIKVR